MKVLTTLLTLGFLSLPAIACDKDSRDIDPEKSKDLSIKAEKKEEAKEGQVKKSAEKVVFVVSKKDQEEDSDY